MDNCNSTPQFTTVPPIVLCKSDALNIDASAADSNGDSLFYEFCDILNGGSSFNPSPTSSDPPPYSSIPFILPQTSSMPIPGTPALTIDPLTGFITGVANTTGQFVVGICVSEYENGTLLSKVRRDYQFNITSCISNVVADMLTQIEKPSLLCTGKIMSFQAQTSGAISYLWDFGDTTTTADSSSSPSPSYTYLDTGAYTVMLIINPGLVCTDTVYEVFNIFDAPDYLIKYSGKSCFEAQNLLFYAEGGTPNDASFKWEFGNLSNTFGATGDSVAGVSWSSPGDYTVRLIVSSSTCPDTVYDTISVVQWSVNVDLGNDTSIVRNDTAYLDVSAGSFYQWFADKPVYFNNSRQKNPQAWQYQDSTTFFAIVTDEYGCQGIDTVLIYWLPDMTAPDFSNVQNVITANMDGINDVLDLSEVSFEESCTLRILNRWGGQVYYQDNYDDTWSGVNNNGQPLPPSTYYILLQCDKQLRYSGPVTIIGRGQ
jgi:gliding motility-associated-like protein